MPTILKNGETPEKNYSNYFKTIKGRLTKPPYDPTFPAVQNLSARFTLYLTYLKLFLNFIKNTGWKVQTTFRNKHSPRASICAAKADDSYQ